MSHVERDAIELLRLFRDRQLSAIEATRAAIERIERLNPIINAVVSNTFDQALAAAERADQVSQSGGWLGPLHGVPILIKDLFDFRVGIRNTFGCRATQDFIPDFTMAHIARLEDAGAILLGKTNTPEFGHKAVTDNRHFGPTRCPFDLSRNAGGSSGGSAAAVAAGLVPLAQGSDAGGSIRIPAAWCGVVGFKPTFGRIPNTGGDNVFGRHTPFVHTGPLTRTVGDTALMAQVMSGPHVDDPFSLPDDGMSLHDAPQADVGKLRIAFSQNLGVFAVDPDVNTVVGDCISALIASGMKIDESDLTLPLTQDELAQLWLREVGVVYLEMFASFAQQGPDLLRDHADDIPQAIHGMVELARAATVLDLRRDDTMRTRVWRTFQNLFSDYHILLTPTVGALPVPNAPDGNTLGPDCVQGRTVERCIGWCLTHPLNFTGHPAASIPAGLTATGLPVGLQVIGRRFADEQVITVCRAIEQRRPWLDALAAVATNLEARAVSDGRDGSPAPSPLPVGQR